MGAFLDLARLRDGGRTSDIRRLWDHVGHGVPFLMSAIVMLMLFGLHLLIVHRTKLKFKTS